MVLACAVLISWRTLIYVLSAPPPLSKAGDKSIRILFEPSLIDKIVVFEGTSEDKPLFFSHLDGAEINSFIAYAKQDFSIDVSHFLFTERKLPFESVTNILTVLISYFFCSSVFFVVSGS